MADLKEKIYGVIKNYQLTSLATLTDDGNPWVRYVMMVGEKDLTMKFTTSMKSRKVAHIKNNAEVHITCGVTNIETARQYLQIQGKAKISKDKALRKEMWQDYHKKYFSGPDDPNYCVGVVTPYRIELFSMFAAKPEVWVKKGK
ncbi:MAG: pyridoxamine 5'-phosphate oxidase family protein [Syntrophales bacterium]